MPLTATGPRSWSARHGRRAGVGHQDLLQFRLVFRVPAQRAGGSGRFSSGCDRQRRRLCRCAHAVKAGSRYAATALVHHSHDYKLMDEFHRYFDIGVFYGREHGSNGLATRGAKASAMCWLNLRPCAAGALPRPRSAGAQCILARLPAGPWASPPPRPQAAHQHVSRLLEVSIMTRKSPLMKREPPARRGHDGPGRLQYTPYRRWYQQR